MICYRDTTFCISPNCQNACGRKLTESVRENARKWWGGDGAPIAVGYFCGEPNDDFSADRSYTGERIAVTPPTANDGER